MKTVPNIILASKSARRKEIFEHLGLRPTVLVSGADENIPETDPRLFVEEAAKRKIDAVKHLCSKSDLIIASDTIVFYNGKILGKPNGKSQAIEMLSLLSGTTHKVISGIAVTYNGKTVTSHETTEVTFRKIDQKEVIAYINTGEPFDKAGGYGIQDIAAIFTEKINGDYLNVVGLPVFRLFSLLKLEFQLDFFDFLPEKNNTIKY